MAPVVAVVALALAIPAAVKATQIRTWSGTSCNSGDALTWTGHSVECQQLANVKSLFVDNIDNGCTVTYYSDSYCSNNAVSARVGYCWGYSNGIKLKSWSWDC